MSATTARRRPADATPSPFAIQRAFTALSEARARLADIDPTVFDDDKLLVDCLEGEAIGDPFAVIDALVRGAIGAADLASLAAGRIRALSERKARFDHREERLRAIVLDMLTALDIPKIEREDYSASIRPGQPHVVITDENALADPYVRVVRAPNKAAIRDALKAGDEVAGATLSNPQPVLSIKES